MVCTHCLSTITLVTKQRPSFLLNGPCRNTWILGGTTSACCWPNHLVPREMAFGVRLNSSTLKSPAILQLMMAQVTSLCSHQDLAYNRLDDTAMLRLICGRWPLLQSLDLKFDYALTYHGESALQCSADCPQASHLDLCNTVLDIEGIFPFSQAKLVCLRHPSLA